MPQPSKVFISYSHRDERLVERLRDQLAALRHQGLLTDWYDRRILAGTDWAAAIDQNLEAADLVLLAVSPSFVASDYARGIEMELALARHSRGEAKVIPILLRDAVWESLPFAHLQVLPRNAKPVTRWRDRDQALRDVAVGIKAVLSLDLQAVAVGGSDARAKARSGLFLSHTSFLRKAKQREFQRRTGVPLNHYDIRVVVDSHDPSLLDRIERVEYELDEAYPEPVRVRTRVDRGAKFLLKELANGEYLLKAKVYLAGAPEPVHLERYITLWHSGPELP